MNTAAVNQTADVVSSVYSDNTKTSGVNDKTVGSPKLSEKGQKYFEELKKKYSNMDFVLVEDGITDAEAKAAKYANSGRMQVVIDEQHIEKMAEDEAYRNKYEGIIGNAQAQFDQMVSGLGSNASSVKTLGIKIDDGGNASFFAVIDKSLAAQKERIQEKAEKKAEAKKAYEKEKAEKKREEKLQDKKSEDVETVTSDSIEGLLEKINDTLYASLSDKVRTEDEKKVGQHIDYRW